MGMSITAYRQNRLGQATRVTVTSDLAGTVYYHWYLDGSWIASTRAAERLFVLPPDDQARVEVIDTTDADFDPLANAPAGFPARRTLWWLRSLDLDAERYRVEQKVGSDAWSELAEVVPLPTQWSMEYLTPRLDDLSVYRWRITPVDAAGNDGTARLIGPEKIVRRPDAPRFTISFDEGTTRVTFTEAA